jgi:hypothetical protein
MRVRNDYFEFSINITFDITKFAAFMNVVPFIFSAAYKRHLVVQNFAFIYVCQQITAVS